MFSVTIIKEGTVLMNCDCHGLCEDTVIGYASVRRFSKKYSSPGSHLFLYLGMNNDPTVGLANNFSPCIPGAVETKTTKCHYYAEQEKVQMVPNKLGRMWDGR